MVDRTVREFPGVSVVYFTDSPTRRRYILCDGELPSNLLIVRETSYTSLPEASSRGNVFEIVNNSLCNDSNLVHPNRDSDINT
jgi:hypothetical protein